MLFQPPSGGCVLKLESEQYGGAGAVQPPSGGCVLKQLLILLLQLLILPAAFGRLCVETVFGTGYANNRRQPPSGGCVLKPNHHPAYNY